MPKLATKAVTSTSIDKPRPGGWTVEQTDSNVYRIAFKAQTKTGWEQWALLTSDRHWDNPKSDQKLQYRHLELAQARKAPCIDAGDFFCVMGGKYDRRASKSLVRPEHANGDYLDRVVETAVDAFVPYADALAIVGRGNHELSIKDRHETDLTDRLCSRLRRETGYNVFAGGYSSWCVFQFNFSTQVYSRTLRWTHGHGGGGPVTEDLIQGQRSAVNFDADYLASGHTHHAWANTRVRQKVNQYGQLENRMMRLIKIPSYKDAFLDGRESWEISKGHPPKPIGCVWIRWFWDGGLCEEIHQDTRAGLS